MYTDPRRDFEAHRKQFDREFARTRRTIGVIWTVGAVIGLSVTAVAIWAVIRIVQHYT